MMNPFLKFKRSSLHRKYYEHLNQRFLSFILFFDIFLIIDLVLTLVYMSIQISKDEGCFYLSYRKTIIFLILNTICFLIFSIYSLYLHFKLKTYSDLLFLCTYFFFLALFSETMKISSISPLLCYIFTLFNLLFMTAYRYLLIKFIHLIGNLIYFVVFYWKMPFDGQEIFFPEIVLMTIMVMIQLYLIEKSEKSAFLNSYSFEKEKKTFNELMNILPEGVAIFQKNMKELFINNSMKTLYEETDVNSLRDKIFKETKRKLAVVSDLSINPSHSECSYELNPSFRNFINKKTGIKF